MLNNQTLNLSIVIMAGGAGTRFWPLSTEKRPKQFLKLFGERSLLQKSYDRVASLLPPERILVLTSASFTELVKEQLPEIPEENIIGEPMRRDTAAAVALAALLCRKRFGNTITGIMTADHIIEPVELFQKTLLSAAEAAANEAALYTIGIEPTYPATGFGYLECSDELSDDSGIKHYTLKQFKEKPDIDTATGYLESGRFLWNSGMFVWQTDAILSAFETHLPGHLRHIEKAIEADASAEWPLALEEAFEPLEKISIDFAIMEKAEDVRTVAASFSWSDVGGWLALEEFLQSDDKGNHRSCGLETLDAASNLVFSEDSEETVALVGVSNLIVVRAGSRTLIVDKDRAEDIKKLVAGLDDKLK
ncbi:MAG: NTP transferase domain-containing protein [Proteobacteria bacterium]|nr:NTP transferase domain-containing protein [Pseudomonadota bacterium]